MPTVGPLIIRGSDDRFLAASDVAERIVNMVPTERGSLRSFLGLVPYQPAVATSLGFPVQPSYFGEVLGVCHAMLNNGERDCLLIWDEDSVRVHQGWTPGWGDGGLNGGDCLLGPATRTPILTMEVPKVEYPSAPPQWVVTDKYVIIIPQVGRSYITDGDIVLPLGYDRAPGPPRGKGPITLTTRNDGAYSHDGSSTNAGMGVGRVGTAEAYQGVTGYFDTTGTYTEGPGYTGTLLESHYQAAVQWVDQFGNVSPLGQKSVPLVIAAEDSHDGAGTYKSLDDLPKFVCWEGISKGPPGTIGRIVFATRDLKHSGDTKFYEVPAQMAGGYDSFATIMDNVVDTLPYNIHEGWLGGNPMEPVPVPEFRVGAWSGTRLWIGGIVGSPSDFMWSVPLLPGTFLKHSRYRAPSGKATAVYATSAGIFLFTETSLTIAVESGDQMSFSTPSTPRGAVAPDSVAQLVGGNLVWFGGDSFYMWDGSKVVDIGAPIRDRLSKVNKARMVQAFAEVHPRTGSYICVVPEDTDVSGGTAYVYDKGNWSFITGIQGRQFSTTKDHRNYLLMAGINTGKYRIGDAVTSSDQDFEGVWIWNADNYSYDQPEINSYIETTWIRAEVPQTRMSGLKVRLWLLESGNDLESANPLSIRVFQDYRKVEVMTTTMATYAVEDDSTGGPPAWGVQVLGQGNWAKLRPFVREVGVEVRAAESIKISIGRTDNLPWEFLGMQVDTVTHSGSGRQR